MGGGNYKGKGKGGEQKKKRVHPRRQETRSRQERMEKKAWKKSEAEAKEINSEKTTRIKGSKGDDK